MKDRLILAGLIILLWIFLFIFQKFTSVESSIFIILGFMAVYALLLHAAQFHQKRKIRKKPLKLDYNYNPFVTILIPAHNEENVIENTLSNMLGLDYDKFEIIVIDDRSTDNTVKVLENFVIGHRDKLKFYKRGEDAFPGKSAVLNEALKMSQGEVICVFDADARVNPDFLRKILPYLAGLDIGAVQARKVINNSNTNFLTRCQNNEYALDSHFQAGRDSIRGAVELRGNGQLIKTKALKDVDGWNNFTITDDLDLSTRLHLKGWDIRFCPDVEVYEEAVKDFYSLLKQRRRWVEGSIRRYLDYFTEVLCSRDISLRVGLDMCAYISEFVLPVWLVSEWAIQGIKIARGAEHNILSSLAVILAICLFFVMGLVYGLKKYHRLKLSDAIVQAVETGIYMIIIWTPVVLFIVFKIVFLKRTMDWGKTVHGVHDAVETEELEVKTL